MAKAAKGCALMQQQRGAMAAWATGTVSRQRAKPTGGLRQLVTLGRKADGPKTKPAENTRA